MDDSRIIELLFAREESAIVELNAVYGKAIKQICYNILGSREDAEECANDTYLAVWNAIPPAMPSVLKAYVLRIARNLAIKRARSNHAAKRNSRYDICLEELEFCLPAKNTVESEMAQKELVKTLENFALSLGSLDRAVFIRRYWYFESARDSASELGLTENNINVRLTKIRKKLKKHLYERGIEI